MRWKGEEQLNWALRSLLPSNSLPSQWLSAPPNIGKRTHNTNPLLILFNPKLNPRRALLSTLMFRVMLLWSKAKSTPNRTNVPENSKKWRSDQGKPYQVSYLDQFNYFSPTVPHHQRQGYASCHTVTRLRNNYIQSSATSKEQVSTNGSIWMGTISLPLN